MPYFLAKTDPDTYSIDHLEREKQTVWDGVTNPQAVKAILEMAPGDRIFVYHSGGLSAVAGVRAAGVACGLKKNGRPDLALVVADGPATVAATFTQNLVQAAPILLSKRHLRGGRFSALVLNSGNANACTGRQGLRDAEETAREVARLLGRPVGEVFVASTGVIGRRLEMGAVRAGIGEAVRRLSATGGGKAAQSWMTCRKRPPSPSPSGSDRSPWREWPRGRA